MSLPLQNMMPLVIVGFQLSLKLHLFLDALSRLPSTNKETLINDVIKALYHAALVSTEEAFAVECVLAQNASIDDYEAGTVTGSDLCQVDGLPNRQLISPCIVLTLCCYCPQDTNL